MEKLTPKKKLAVVKLYLSGLSYDEIALKSGVSKGTVANVVTELKSGAFPEAADGEEQIEMLRELSLDLKHLGLSPGQCAVGLAVLNRIKECGLDAADINRWPAILKAVGSDEQAKAFIQVIYRIEEAQAKTGLTLEEADEKLQELEAKTSELAPLAKKVEEQRQVLKQLSKQRADVAAMVNNLTEKFAFLNPRVKDLEQREGELSKRAKDWQSAITRGEAVLATLAKEEKRLLEAGFSIEALAEFNDRTRAIAAHHKVPIPALRERLLHELEILNKGLGLETLVQGQRAELKQQKQAIASAANERAVLEAGIIALEQQKAALEASIRVIGDKVNTELAKIAPAARQTVVQLVKDLELGREAVLHDVQLIRDQALEIGKEIGRYEGIVKTNEWILDLLSLARGENSVEAARVRVILLQVLRGARSRMKAIEAKSGYVAPAYTTERLIGELEQWKTQ